MKIEMIPVRSSNLKEIGYDHKNELLIIIFHKGDAYRYTNVPYDTYTQLMKGDPDNNSIGKYFCAHIRTNPQYRYSKLREKSFKDHDGKKFYVE
ncbi:Putative conserved hypothetical protein [Candidatus Fokinia solitaria]|uniref:KTSC domain-containing protein n=1 Tax=Candidatus Fokinia solitaria TaxID=1802984 RepID=A0A2U8BS00_9RICK|nr:KTSC domain-containing protein [Candidatus Fokinia solitaria]AWD33119.1 Putative conserved hypothetical protein [Candidatus Fokinia solitaria]